MPRPGSGWSLTRRLLWVVITALTAVAVALGVAGTVLINRVVEESFDRLLAAAVQEITGTVALERGDVTFDIPPSALGMLENDQRDSVYYSVRQGSRILTGYADLPVVAIGDARPGDTVFDYADYRDQRIRIAAGLQHLPRTSDPISVQVAQTMGERRSLELVMLAALYILEACFVVIAGLLVWPTLKWNLEPVNSIREELDSRPADIANFAPLELHNAPAELVGLIGGFNDLLQRLEGAVAGMRQFTADASHEMRTPLAVLKTHLAVLEQHVLPESVASGSIADVRGAVSRLEALLTRLITLARADRAVRAGIARESTDLYGVIAQVTGELLPLAAQREIALSVEAQAVPAWVHADSVMATEILTNLLDNAIRYNRPGGSVCIGIREDDGGVELSVEDDGPGIPEAEMSRVFERFYRLPRDQGQPGTGLGLSIVRTLSEALKATVSVELPASGRGLRAIVRFEPAPPA